MCSVKIDCNHAGRKGSTAFNPLNAQLNPICHFLALLGAHPILHVSRIRVKISVGLIIVTTLILK
jgi:hypothetical protein